MGIARFKQLIRCGEQSDHRILRFGSRLIFGLWRFIGPAVRYLTNKRYRSEVMVKLLKPAELHQTLVVTWMDRYPEIFAVCRDWMRQRTDIRILSYGCATGEEVITLRRYFPDARIIGAEINPFALAECRKLQVDSKISFIAPDTEAIGRQAPYDVVFCLAVLQRDIQRISEQKIDDIGGIYPFAKFDQKLQELDGWVRKNGLLVVFNSQYRVIDSSIVSRYTPLVAALEIRDSGPKFDRNSRLIDGVTSAQTVFLKVRD